MSTEPLNPNPQLPPRRRPQRRRTTTKAAGNEPPRKDQRHEPRRHASSVRAGCSDADESAPTHEPVQDVQSLYVRVRSMMVSASLDFASMSKLARAASFEGVSWPLALGAILFVTLGQRSLASCSRKRCSAAAMKRR